MNLKDIILPDQIFHFNNTPANKYVLLENLLDKTLNGNDCKKHRQEILSALLERERSMSTGIGSGIAIPHCATDYVDGMLASMAILPEKISFEAVDDQPVGIVVLLLLSKNDFDRHIKTLAAIARAFNQEVLRQAVQQTTNSKEVIEIFDRFCQ
ncbi:MAG: PTS sugar transporter subunit IIA [Leptonema sp. (in: Bacteria)]|nr:PTS sugar transporter subunit IIA [Leptonema sp. (in: bacteria)]